MAGAREAAQRTISPHRLFEFSTFAGARFDFPSLRGFLADSGGNLLVLSEVSENFVDVSGFPTYRYGPGGNRDILVSKFAGDGTLIWSASIGGPAADRAGAVMIDSDGSLIIAGMAGNRFPVTPGTREIAPDETRIVLVRLAPDGDSLLASSSLPVSGFPTGLTRDRMGRFYLAGSTIGDVPPPAGTPGFGRQFLGESDSFVTRLNAAGDRLDYFNYYGGTGLDGWTKLAVGADGRCYIAVETSSMDVPQVNPFFTYEQQPGEKAMLAGISPDGTQLEFSTLLPTSRVNALLIGPSGGPLLAAAGSSSLPRVKAVPGGESGRGPCMLELSPDGQRVKFGSLVAPGGRGEATDMHPAGDGTFWVSGPLRGGRLKGAHRMIRETPAGFIARIDPRAGRLLLLEQVPYAGGIAPSPDGSGMYVMEWWDSSSGLPDVRYRAPIFNAPLESDGYRAFGRIVPASLQAAPRVSISRTRIDFGILPDTLEPTDHYADIILRNRGRSTLTGTIVGPGQDYGMNLQGGNRSYSLEPGEKLKLTVRWRAGGRLYEDIGSIAISTNDPRRGSILVFLRGRNLL